MRRGAGRSGFFYAGGGVKPAGESKSLKKTALDLVSRAAEAGIENAYLLPGLSPREIDLLLKAIEKKRREEAQRMDMQAWLVGRYVLAAVHAPRRYPRRPDGFGHEKKAMTDGDMKRVFAVMAARREEEHGGS